MNKGTANGTDGKTLDSYEGIMNTTLAKFAPEVRIWDSCGCIRVNLTNDGKLLEQHVFPSWEMSKAIECAEKMEEGVKAAERTLRSLGRIS